LGGEKMIFLRLKLEWGKAIAVCIRLQGKGKKVFSSQRFGKNGDQIQSFSIDASVHAPYWGSLTLSFTRNANFPIEAVLNGQTIHFGV